MIRVALDTNALYTTRAGIARYIQGLRRGLAEINDDHLRISELAWEVENFEFKQPARSSKTFYRELIWAPLIAPGILKKNKIDILHSLAGPFIKPPKRIGSVITLHDLAVFRFPERFRTWHRRAAVHRLQQLHKADQIICVSQFTADEATKLLKIESKKLVVIHNGAERFSSESRWQGAPKFPSEYFLFVGSLEPGKNLALLRDMYALAESKNHSLPPLVIIGARWSGVPDEGASPKNWIYLGRQPDSVLRRAYEGAKALLFPSIYEGFGLPIVEAQMAGCPTICSPVASLPEVAGTGALFADLTPHGYFGAISRLERDSGLRDNLIREGKTNALRFSWSQCAQATVAVYRQTHRASR
jgi:glycosyltransferase involved in cell wall biosynthesis